MQNEIDSFMMNNVVHKRRSKLKAILKAIAKSAIGRWSNSVKLWWRIIDNFWVLANQRHPKFADIAAYSLKDEDSGTGAFAVP